MTTQPTPYKEVNDLLKASEVIARAFQPNAWNLYTTKHVPLETNVIDFYNRLFQLKTHANASIIQSDDEAYTSIAVWIPPEFDTPTFPEPLIPEFREAEDIYASLLKKYLKGKRHWHLTILAKDPLNASIKGSTSKVVKPFLEMAKEQNVPAMLECIDERAKAIYEHYGFEVLEEFKIGVGKCDAEGNPKEGGEGVTAWYMVFNL